MFVSKPHDRHYFPVSNTPFAPLGLC